ncbi:uncharacterized protein BDW47DRAFT_111090 [Aspergillus candidus]|uniref:Uncharacterized protein n=1 Tax=Aspergillus candidus TaxID=41067 RepID=A0A2I2F338_ASPCN|nr:hypothetical protein BDW47DRAFT_111090 [Aspergillus candidus]PLB35044.1 hypothetical protein BDW47DRAFT_111090 [Aspergillus candidus]
METKKSERMDLIRSWTQVESGRGKRPAKKKFKSQIGGGSRDETSIQEGRRMEWG